jgi:ribose transport system substrate-binding protein
LSFQQKQYFLSETGKKSSGAIMQKPFTDKVKSLMIFVVSFLLIALGCEQSGVLKHEEKLATTSPVFNRIASSATTSLSFSRLPERNEKMSARIGILYWSMNIPGQVAMRTGIEKEFSRINQKRAEKGLTQLEKIELVAGDGDQGIEKQIRQMAELIEKQVDLIIVQPTDITALSGSLKKANEANIPVVAYDQHIVDGELECFLTSNNYQAGYLAGEYVASKFPAEKELKALIIEYPQVFSTVERVNGFIDALESYRQKYRILHSYSAVEPVSGQIAARKILDDFPGKNSIDLIFAVNDGGGVAVARELEKAGRDEIFLATVDGDPEAVEIIRNGGIIKFDAAQFCSALGVETMKKAYKLLTGQKVLKKYLIPTFPIASETLNLYQGWYSEIPESFEKPWACRNKAWNNLLKASNKELE